MKLKKEKCAKLKTKKNNFINKAKKGVVSYGIYINNIWMVK